MRVLYKILLLNMWHGIRRSRYMVPAFMLGIGLLLAGGGFLTVQTVQMAEQKLSSAASSADGSDTRSNTSLGVPKQSSLSNDGQSSAGPTKGDASDTQKSSSPSSGAQPAADDLRVISVTLDPATSTCTQGQRTYQVKSAALALAGGVSSGKSVKWYWETRIDGGQAPDQGSVLSGEIRTLTLSGNDQETVLTGPAADESLISAAANASYAYSFRLHIVGPNDIASAWVAVPIIDEASAC